MILYLKKKYSIWKIKRETRKILKQIDDRYGESLQAAMLRVSAIKICTDRIEAVRRFRKLTRCEKANSISIEQNVYNSSMSKEEILADRKSRRAYIAKILKENGNNENDFTII